MGETNTTWDASIFYFWWHQLLPKLAITQPYQISMPTIKTYIPTTTINISSTTTNKPTTTTNIPTTTSAEEVCTGHVCLPEENGFFVEGCCENSYCQCYGGVGHLKHCGEGVFNEELQACD